jgi:DNA-binding transcriptional MerR regulator
LIVVHHSEEGVFKIGDFSRLSFVSIKTLRYYDDLGLLKPVSVDPFSGYRYYSADQLPRLNRILALRDLGLSLTQITALLDRDLRPDQITEMLVHHRREIDEHIHAEESRLQRVEARIRQMKEEGKMPEYEVILRSIPSFRVAGFRSIAPSYGQPSRLWETLEYFLLQNHLVPTGASLSIYHDRGYREKNVNIEVCAPTDALIFSGEKVSIHDLPAVDSMACAIHQGEYAALANAYQAMMTWIEANHYQIYGPIREVYLEQVHSSLSGDSAQNVTEIQIPVHPLS